MNLKSEMLSAIMKIMLWALIALSGLDLIATLVYAMDLNFYLDYIYSFNSFINIVSFVLYYLIVVLYLIWIYRVHIDLNHLFDRYPRSPGMSIAYMIIPFYNLYGLPSTYLRIGEYYEESVSAKRQGLRISGLAVPLIICFMTTGILNRYIANADGDASAILFIVTGVFELGTYIVFLCLCIFVSQGLKEITNHKAALLPEIEDLEDWNTSEGVQ
jgi:hypothetical protein